MQFFLQALLFLLMSPAKPIFDFTPSTPSDAWGVQDDVVMGGRSKGNFSISEDGHGLFSGHVSLENNGGFSSILHTLPEAASVDGNDRFILRVKGDGKNYSIRVKSNPKQNYYHEAEFSTSAEWQTVEVPFSSMKAVHHGEPVQVPNYAGEPITKMQLLVGNGKAEDFKLLIDWIGAN